MPLISGMSYIEAPYSRTPGSGAVVPGRKRIDEHLLHARVWSLGFGVYGVWDLT